MTTTHEVISAFLDDESFDPTALTEALADPAGRALLIDLIALRHVVRIDSSMPAATTAGRQVWMRLVLPAAAVMLALLGGYQWGTRRGATALPDPPAVTVVVPATTGWRQ
jgi:hypothetical protein